MNTRAVVPLLGLTVVCLLLGSRPSAVTQQGASGPHGEQANLDAPPKDARYQAAISLGVRGNYRAARAEFSALAHEHPGTATGAWALYQAALGARAQKDEPGFRKLATELRRDYPGHRLTLMPGFRDERADAPRAKPRLPDCGPRSLLHLCGEAGIGTDRETVARLCATDRHGTTLEGLRKGAEALGMRAAPAQVDAAFLRRHRPSGVAWTGDHFTAFLPGPTRGHFWVFDPNVGERRPVTAGELMRMCNGIVLLTAWGERKLPRLDKD